MTADEGAFFRHLTERSPIALTLVDADGTWRWSSEAGNRLHGSLEPGTRIDEVFPGEYQSALLGLIGQAARSDTAREPVDLRLRGIDGRWHSLTVSAENMLDAPEVNGIVLYATDTTRLYETRQRVRIESARLDTLIAALSSGILLQDENRDTILVNRVFTEMFGIAADPRSLIGLSAHALAQLVAGDAAGGADPDESRADEIVAIGQPASAEEVFFADGRIAECDYVPVHLDGATHGHLWVFRDVTEQRLILRGLEERNRSLAELASLKTEFIATASHELRTPLTSILTFAHLMEEPGCGAHEREHAMGAITRNADRMLRLVDDLILLASLEAGTAPLRLMPVDLSALVRSAIETWDPVAAKAGVKLACTIGDGPRLSADSRHLHQLVETLFGTALATTPRGGAVEVAAGFEDPYWTIELSRSSSGTTATGGDHIFTRPGRQDDPSAAHSNALAFLLSRAVVARHGGQMISPDDTGILVRLPLVPPPNASGLD
ncbi:MAG: hypothetical protein QOD41_1867 [Cryptosporangiaceae bacterium]|nr:hypothetical protein [Cryptosporangiaceae bacterium]